MAVEEHELLHLHSRHDDDGNETTRLRVVRWNDYPPQLENRTRFRGKRTGKRQWGKNTGIRAQEYEILLQRSEEIREALKGGDDK